MSTPKPLSKEELDELEVILDSHEDLGSFTVRTLIAQARRAIKLEARIAELEAALLAAPGIDAAILKRATELEAENARLIEENKTLYRDEKAACDRGNRLAGRCQALESLLSEAEGALEFYAGKASDGWWEGCRFMAVDKFGGLDDDLSGPGVAERALSKLREARGGGG